MSWTLLKLRRRGDALDEDLVHSLHFFLVPQVDNIQIQSVAEDELDAAIDEGRPNRSMKYLVSRGLVGSVAIYGAALLVSAPVVLTATALYGAKKACVVSLTQSLVSHSLISPHSQGNTLEHRYDKRSLKEEEEKIEEIVPLEPSLTIRPCPKLKVQLTHRLLDIYDETSKWPLLPDRTYGFMFYLLYPSFFNLLPQIRGLCIHTE
jgi:hypothetical protein